MSFAAQGTVPPMAACALVLGANLGTAINPLLESGIGHDPAAKRLPAGNLVNRIVGVGCALVALPYLTRWIVMVEPNNARAIADFHTAFNVVLALIFFPLLTPYAALLKRWLPTRVDQTDPGRPIYLDPSAQETPVIALGGAAREALRMADVLETMLQGLRDTFDRPVRRQIGETKRMDDVLDRLNAAIKAYVTALDSDAMGNEDLRRAREILTFATNMEQAGDAVDRNLLGISNKLAKRGLSFSEDGKAELLGMIDRLIANVRTASSLFMTGDERAARLLATEKEAFRGLQSASTDAHFERLRSKRVESAETTSLHLDALRDLKIVNGHVVAAAAYPVLENKGEILPSRLRNTRSEFE
jgi:phosphate:Na+ symporter